MDKVTDTQVIKGKLWFYLARVIVTDPNNNLKAEFYCIQFDGFMFFVCLFFWQITVNSTNRTLGPTNTKSEIFTDVYELIYKLYVSEFITDQNERSTYV